jgi:hypothetical protein
VTTYTYDDHGRVIEAVTITESEWDETEQAWAMLLIDIEADTCGGCGQPLTETLTLEAYEGYESGPPAVCQGCKALHRRQEEYREDKDVNALRFSVRRTWEEEKDHGY